MSTEAKLFINMKRLGKRRAVTNSRGHAVHKENIVLLERRLSVARDSTFFEKSKKSTVLNVKCFDSFESCQLIKNRFKTLHGHNKALL